MKPTEKIEQVRIKKGVRPFGGRIFDVVERGQYSDGRAWVDIDTTHRTDGGVISQRLVRRYQATEVEHILRASK
jgi:hypothetical protein